MKIILTTQDNSVHELEPPPAGASDVGTPLTCPHCHKGLRIFGRHGTKSRGHDYIEETALCSICQKPVGRIRVIIPSLFGLEEDKRVLNGRCRVY
jgi:hypothetical protein